MLKNISVYSLYFWIWGLNELFSKDAKIIESRTRINERITQEVLNPELSELGLRKRQKNITLVSYALGFIGGMLLIFGCGSLMILSAPFSIVLFVYCIVSYFLGLALYIALFRATRASIDEMRFRRHSRSENFLINTKAHVKRYDFLITLPIAFLPIFLF